VRSPFGPRALVGLLVAACLFYLGLIGWRGIILLDSDRWAARGLGVGVLLLPVVGVVVLVREVRFGAATARLARDLATSPAPADAGADADGEPELPRRPSGRIDRAAADAVFARRRLEVEAAPADWRAWYRLAAAYGDAGDTRRGRRAMRHAIGLAERDESSPAPDPDASVGRATGPGTARSGPAQPDGEPAAGGGNPGAAGPTSVVVERAAGG
jgi:hypothetical protein